MVGHKSLQNIIQTNYWLAPFAAFLGGVLTASNPCVLAMIPLAMGFAGERESGMALCSLYIAVFRAGAFHHICDNGNNSGGIGQNVRRYRWRFLEICYRRYLLTYGTSPIRC